MTDTEKFVFADTEFDHQSQDCFNGVMRLGVSNVDQLMDAIADALDFPAYFGANWNALSDCLTDFNWIDQRTVLLTHHEIPKINIYDLKTYLSVLQDAVDDWKDGEDHEFFVVFPASSEFGIRNLLQERG